MASTSNLRARSRAAAPIAARSGASSSRRCERSREAVHVARRDEQPRLAVRDDVRQPADATRDERRARGRRLDRRGRAGVGPQRGNAPERRAEPGAHDLVVRHVMPDDHVVLPNRPDARVRRPDQDERRRRLQSCVCAQQRRHALVLRERAHVEDVRAVGQPLGPIDAPAGGERAQRQEVRDDLDRAAQRAAGPRDGSTHRDQLVDRGQARPRDAQSARHEQALGRAIFAARAGDALEQRPDRCRATNRA